MTNKEITTLTGQPLSDAVAVDCMGLTYEFMDHKYPAIGGPHFVKPKRTPEHLWNMVKANSELMI